MKFLLLGLFVAAVAAAPKLSKNDQEEQLQVVVPDPILIPEPELPVIIPAPIIIPEPELPVVMPDPIIIPEPELPVIVPDPIIIPEPDLPEVVPSPVVPQPPQIINSEIFNDGVVQVQVNADSGLFSSLHSWVSVVFNYIKDGFHSTHQILGY